MCNSANIWPFLSRIHIRNQNNRIFRCGITYTHTPHALPAMQMAAAKRRVEQTRLTFDLGFSKLRAKEREREKDRGNEIGGGKHGEGLWWGNKRTTINRVVG